MKEEEVKDKIATYLRTELTLSGADRLTVDYGEIGVMSGYLADVVVKDGTVPRLAIECKRGSDIRKAIGQAYVYRQAGISAGVAGVDIPEEQLDAVRESKLHGYNIVEGNVHELNNPDICQPANQARIEILEEKLESTRELLE